MIITVNTLIEVLPIVAYRGWRISLLQNGRFRRAFRDRDGMSPVAALACEIDPKPAIRDATVAAVRLSTLLISSNIDAVSAEQVAVQVAALRSTVASFASACEDEDSMHWAAIRCALEVPA